MHCTEKFLEDLSKTTNDTPHNYTSEARPVDLSSVSFVCTIERRFARKSECRRLTTQASIKVALAKGTGLVSCASGTEEKLQENSSFQLSYHGINLLKFLRSLDCSTKLDYTFHT
jgi:hypothetical protein